MSIAEAIGKIRQSGFSIEADGDSIAIVPFSELSDDQIDWLRDHKAAILAELMAPANDGPIIVECWTPSGILRRVSVSSPEEAEFVRRMNPKPPAVKCADCVHAIVTSGIAKCGAGMDSGLPIGGFWATDIHLCGHFE